MASVLFKKDFSLSHYDWIGFDMDHALVKYNVPAVTQLIYDAFVDFLTTTKDFDASIFTKFDPTFCSKDVVMCFDTGDFLKLDENGRVTRGTHGTTPLTKDQIQDKYGSSAWDRYHILKGPTDYKHPSFHYCVTYFDTPVAFVMAQLVDWADAQGKEYTFKDTVWEGFSHHYSFDNFTNSTGGFFPPIQADVGKYIAKRPKLKAWLQQMRAAGKRLFLATNSHIEFSELLMTHAFGYVPPGPPADAPPHDHVPQHSKEWHDLFDLVMVHCGKPGFFSDIASFRRLDSDGGIGDGGAAAVLRVKDRVLVRGNHMAVEALASLDQHHYGDSAYIELDEDGHVVAHGCDNCGMSESVATGAAIVAATAGTKGQQDSETTPLVAATDAVVPATDDARVMAATAQAESVADTEPLLADAAGAGAGGGAGGGAGAGATATAAAADDAGSSSSGKAKGKPECSKSVLDHKPRFLYVGDHVYGDTLASSHFADWDAICVVEELEDHAVPGADMLKAITATPKTSADAADADADASGDDSDDSDSSHSSWAIRHTKSGRFLSATWGNVFDGHEHFGTKSHFLRLLETHSVAAVSDALQITQFPMAATTSSS